MVCKPGLHRVYLHTEERQPPILWPRGVGGLGGPRKDQERMETVTGEVRQTQNSQVRMSRCLLGKCTPKQFRMLFRTRRTNCYTGQSTRKHMSTGTEPGPG